MALLTDGPDEKPEPLDSPGIDKTVCACVSEKDARLKKTDAKRVVAMRLEHIVSIVTVRRPHAVNCGPFSVYNSDIPKGLLFR